MLTLAVVTSLSAAAVWAAAPAFGTQQPAFGQLSASGFAGGVAIPVRTVEIERERAGGSRNVLVHVRCAGRAHWVSLCWVAKR